MVIYSHGGDNPINYLEANEMKFTLDSGAFAPTRAHKTDAGLDLRSPICIEVPANGSAVIDTGVHVELPNGTVGFLKSKSGLNVKHDITSREALRQNCSTMVQSRIRFCVATKLRSLLSLIAVFLM